MGPKKKGQKRSQAVVGTKRANEPDTQLPVPGARAGQAAAVKAEDAGRAEVPSTSKNMQANAATQEINTEVINTVVQAR